MDPKTCAALPSFHAITSCDTLIVFVSRGMKTSWKVWELFADVTKAFNHILLMENDIAKKNIVVIGVIFFITL